MSIYESRKRKITWVVVVLFFGTVILGKALKFHTHIDTPDNKTVVHLPYKTMYNSIISTDINNLLISYELHEDGEYTDGDISCPAFSAVIRDIDSQKDNYKVMCKDIVSDIVKNCGDKHVKVDIYDSFEAYTLARAYEQQFKVLNKEEEDTINKHRVATYEVTYADVYDDPVYSLTYYPDAGNKLSEKETF